MHANTNAILEVKGPLALAAVFEQHDQKKGFREIS